MPTASRLFIESRHRDEPIAPCALHSARATLREWQRGVAALLSRYCVPFPFLSAAGNEEVAANPFSAPAFPTFRVKRR